jgi:hypothetical protein
MPAEHRTRVPGGVAVAEEKQELERVRERQVLQLSRG